MRYFKNGILFITTYGRMPRHATWGQTMMILESDNYI